MSIDPSLERQFALSRAEHDARVLQALLAKGCGSAWCLLKRGKVKTLCECPELLALTGARLTALAVQMDKERGI